MRSPAPAVLAVLQLLFLLSAPAAGHPLAPSLLEVHERAGGRADILWRMPLQRPAGADPQPVFPAACRPGPRSRVVEGTALVAAAAAPLIPGDLSARIGADAAILFADILTLPADMGFEIELSAV